MGRLSTVRSGWRLVAGVVIMLLAGVVAWRVTSPSAPYSIPKPTFPTSRCLTPLWLRTQGGYETRLGNCLGELVAPSSEVPAAVVTVAIGSGFAMGCMSNMCSTGQPIMTSSNRLIVAFQGVRHGEAYFKAVGHGRASILVRGIVCLAANTSGPLSSPCPAVIIEAR